jgi:hypothetical protein
MVHNIYDVRGENLKKQPVKRIVLVKKPNFFTNFWKNKGKYLTFKARIPILNMSKKSSS